MKHVEWLLFTAQTPTSPSSLRVLVWRRMQQAGAVTLHNGIWILPQTSQHVQTIRELIAEMEKQGGSGFFFIAHTTDSSCDRHIIERFRREREQEYTEFYDRCTALLHELEKETAVGKFTFAELEENEDDLHKLTTWLHKIHARDFFREVSYDVATATLAQCRQALQSFTTAVYAQQGLGTAETDTVYEMETREGEQ